MLKSCLMYLLSNAITCEVHLNYLIDHTGQSSSTSHTQLVQVLGHDNVNLERCRIDPKSAKDMTMLSTRSAWSILRQSKQRDLSIQNVQVLSGVTTPIGELVLPTRTDESKEISFWLGAPPSSSPLLSPPLPFSPGACSPPDPLNCNLGLAFAALVVVFLVLWF